ncbi:MAG: MFS transporter [Clostridia bacterium]|nr:MFS transporter [Clostridia bacterium]
MGTHYSKRGIVILCSLVYFVSYFSRKDFAAVMAAMLEAGVLEKGAAGLIGTALFVFYGVGQLLSGYLGDRVRPRYLLAFGLFTTALCNLLFPFFSLPAVRIALWGLNGLAQAMLWPPIVRILADHLTSEEYASANLVVTTAAHVATILLYLYVPLCLRVFSFEAVFLSAAVLAGVALLAFLIAIGRVLPEESHGAVAVGAPAERRESILPLVRRSGLLPIFGGIVACGFLRDGIESWLPTLYAEAFDRAASESILVSVALPVFSILSITLVRFLHKGKAFRNEARGAAILFLAGVLLSLPLFFLMAAEGTVARVLSLLLAALVCAAMHGVNFLLISCLPGRYAGTGCVSTVSGLSNAFIYVGAALSMYGMALLAEWLGWQATVLSWIAVGAVGGALVLLAARRYAAFIGGKA